MKSLIFVLLFASAAAQADEGMWTFNHFPSAKVKEKYGFQPTQAWLDHVRLSSARIAGGCSGSFVSPNGLIMTNHHCAHPCIAQLSTAQHDYIATGFVSKALADEVKCPEIEIDQLVQITDVSSKMTSATHGLSGEQFIAAQKATQAGLEKDCAIDESTRCEVVTLYHGGQYNLYRYRRYVDVRLVFAPEFSIAFFGGDPDNFMFPRYDLDVSFLRAYDGGKPATTADYLKWNPDSVREHELTFVSGNPGRTDREMTVAELAHERDVVVPRLLLRWAEQRGVLSEFQTMGPEQKREATEDLFKIENAFKGYYGRLKSLQNADFFAAKIAAERALRKKVGGRPAYAGAWDAIARTEPEQGALDNDFYKEGRFPPKQQGPTPYSFEADSFHRAWFLVRLAEERAKPNGQRLHEYVESNLPVMRQLAMSNAPLYNDFEITLLEFSLRKAREALGPDDPYIQKVLGQQSPHQLATSLVSHTQMGNVAYRQALYDGGLTAIQASDDPMIKMALLVDPDGRAIRKKFEDDVESIVKKNHELIARARFEAYGATTYPDATFTARLSYGQVKGFPQNGREVEPFTRLAGAFQRATGQSPFALPATWLAAKPNLDLNAHFDVVTDNDIIGGNSGSPLINQNAEAVGLVFDGNLASLGGDYGFDDRENRTVAVTTTALQAALTQVYGAQRIADELKGSGTGTGAGAR